jgi:hypothetical protein
VKSHGSTVELQGELQVLRKVEAVGTFGGAVKCVDIERNAKGEVRQLGLS